MKKTLQTLVPAFFVLSLCSDAMGMDMSYDQLDAYSSTQQGMFPMTTDLAPPQLSVNLGLSYDQ